MENEVYLSSNGGTDKHRGSDNTVEITVLGAGCQKCEELYRTVQKAVASMKIQASLSKERDITKILSYNILQTPGLVINGKVVSEGRALTLDEAEQLIKKSIQ